ncbi:hypothetical protein HOLleu_40993 [Holothuria leucospilota]|uniref:C2H2-type domain-containing protein n=1 Tax=Holothuria leucospilota TaxID=206669 RepID=A0A9Q1BCD7_HOLLE|nr:hypothetical protein HOLleu_40993 [Holothuria leucospilota]
MTALQEETKVNVPGFVCALPAQNAAQVTTALPIPISPSVHCSNARRKDDTSLNSSLQWDQMKADLNAEISAARKQLTLHDHCLNLQHQEEKSHSKTSHSDSEKNCGTSMPHHRKTQKEGLVNLQIGKVKLQLHPPALGKKQVLFVKYKKPSEEESVVDKPDSETGPQDQSKRKCSSQRDGSSLPECKEQTGADRTTEKRFKICVKNVPDESCSSSDVYFDIAQCIRNEKYPRRSSQIYDEDSTDDSDGDDEDKEKKGNEKPPKMTVSWREMVKTYFCKICVFQSSSIRLACQHLLVEHVAVVEPLGDFLSNKTVFDSDSKQSLYGYILENLPPISRRNDIDGWILEDEGYGGNLMSQSMQAGQSSGGVVMGTSGGMNENEYYQNDGESFHPSHKGKDSEGLTKSSQEYVEDDSCQKKSEKQEIKGESCSGEISRKVSYRESVLLETQDLLSLLRKWMKVHYQCPRCHVKMYFMKMTSFHHCDRTRRTVLCSGCGKYFSSGVYFQHYRRVHSTSKKTGVCKFCNKEMASYLLSNHVRRHHSGPREIYQCGICGRQLGSQQHLSKHEMIHRTEKPYKCPVCQRGFTQRTNMKKHMRQHTGERPYKCEKCEKSFTHNVSLKNHLKRYHGIDLWKEGHTGVGRPKKNKSE